MARVIFNGEPGAVFTNGTEKVLYQLIVNWENSCGLCCQNDRAIGPWWPIPYHRGCRCRIVAIYPGHAAEPYVDFRQKVADLPRGQQTRVVGRANLTLIEAGKVQWSDVVTSNRVRTLEEVASRKKLSVREMTDAGVKPSVAMRAHAAVNTPEHVQADAQRKAIVARLNELGVGKEEIKARFGKAIADRVGIDAGPSGPDLLPVPRIGPKPGGGPAPLPLPLPKKPGPKPVAKPDEVKAAELVKLGVKPEAIKEVIPTVDLTSLPEQAGELLPPRKKKKKPKHKGDPPPMDTDGRR
jgi:hypothetical protein